MATSTSMLFEMQAYNAKDDTFAMIRRVRGLPSDTWSARAEAIWLNRRLARMRIRQLLRWRL